MREGGQTLTKTLPTAARFGVEVLQAHGFLRRVRSAVVAAMLSDSDGAPIGPVQRTFVGDLPRSPLVSW